MLDQAEHLRRLAASVSQQERQKQAKKRIPRVITVTSGKGGVGKTSFVVNLAIVLSRLGKKVTVMDADLGLANVDVMLGLVPLHTLHDVVQGRKTLEEILITGPEGIKIIAGANGLAELANLTEKQRGHLVNSLLYLEEASDVLLIDTSAGLSPSVLSFIFAADELVVITTPDPTAITDAYGIVKVVASEQPQPKIKLVVNLVNSESEGRAIAERFAEVSRKFLQLELQFLGIISNDQHVVRAVRQQLPFVISFPRAKAAQDVQAIAHALLALPVEAPRGIRGFLARLAALWEKSGEPEDCL